MIDKILLERLTVLVAKSNRILVASHKNCGDASGAVTACQTVLQEQGKQVVTFLPAPVPASFAYLKNSEKVITDPNVINWSDYDLFLCLDAAEPWLTGLGGKWPDKPEELTVVNFDHHLTNTGYGDLNIVDKSAAATCSMLMEWFSGAGYFINPAAATSLLNGILTDTGSFCNPATNELALNQAGELLRLGANVNRFLSEVVKSKSLLELKIWGQALERLQINDRLGLVTTIITKQDLATVGLGSDAVEGLANFLNDLSGIKAVLVLKEQSDGTVKGSLRTTHEDIDVAKLARVLGGGGHRKAAGFTVVGQLAVKDGIWQIL
ncbi:MAG: DHH family phosphoesterase [Patescibacteria group bacterium]